MARGSNRRRHNPAQSAWAARLLFALLAVAPLALCGCSAGKPPANTVVMLIESSPSNLDPRIGTDSQSARIDMLLFDTLVKHDSQFGFQPSLATSWQTPNPDTYIFHLRAGATFSNGKPLTARDVKWTFESMLDGTLTTVKSGAYEEIAGIETPNPLTVIFHLKHPDNAFLENLSDGAIGIVPYGSGKNFHEHPIGSGPFEFVSQSYDRDVVIQRNPHYWGVEPHIQQVRFNVVPDATTRALELEKGSADAESNALPEDTVRALRRDRNLRIVSQPGTEIYYLVFNLRDPILRHLRVRQAIAYAINRPLIIQSLFGGDARLASSLLPPEHWAWAATPTYNYNPAKADQLLDQAGFSRGKNGVRFQFTMQTSTDETTRLMAMAIQAELAQVGIQMKLQSYEFATFYSDLVRGAFQVAPSRWIGGNEQPDIFRYSYASSSYPPYGANRGYFHNPTVDRLIDEASTSPDKAIQKRDYAEIQQIVARQLPTFDMFYLDNILVHSRRLIDVKLVPSPSGNFDFLETARLRH